MFCPNGNRAKVTANSVSQRVDISSVASELGAIRVRGEGTKPYINFGDSIVTATTSTIKVDTATEIFKIPSGTTHMACITDGANIGLHYILGQKV